MKHKQFHNIINRQYRELHALAERIPPALDSEDIHRFRVAYKKLRAFFRMLSYKHAKWAGIRFPGRIKNIYHIAGEVRDLQLLYQEVLLISGEEGKASPGCLAGLLTGIGEMKPVLSEMILKETAKYRKRKLSLTTPHVFHRKYFLEFIHNKYNRVGTIIRSADFSDTRIHTIRKNLKDLVYNIDLKPDKRYSGEVSLENICDMNDRRNFTLMLEELGTYHDKAVSIAILKNSRYNILRNCDREFIKHIRTAWIKDKAELKRSLIKKLLKHISS